MATGWNTVTDETQVKFTENGDEFTGRLISLDSNGGIPQAHFTGTGKFTDDGGYFTNAGHDLLRKLERIPLGSEVRITRTGTMDTGQRTPMMLFKVDWRA